MNRLEVLMIVRMIHSTLLRSLWSPIVPRPKVTVFRLDSSCTTPLGGTVSSKKLTSFLILHLANVNPPPAIEKFAMINTDAHNAR
jgi:hypothetical protein